MSYTPAGLDVELTVPLTHERWPRTIAPAATADRPT
jgi:hypothetical protein